MDFKDAELVYKTALVYTASSQRLILVLYNKMIVELKKTMAKYRTNKTEAMQSLHHASKVMTELMNIFLTTPDPAYHEMYMTHEPIVLEMAQMFAQGNVDPRRLHEIISLMAGYREAWKKALKIRDRRFPSQRKTRPLNIRHVIEDAEREEE